MRLNAESHRYREGICGLPPIRIIPLPKEVMHVIDSLIPRIPRLEDFDTEKLAVVGWNQHGKGWKVPSRIDESPVPLRAKIRNRY